MTPRVVYSSGTRFAGGGGGNVSYHGVAALHRRGMLERLLCGSFRETEIPRARIRSMGLVSRVLRRSAVYDPAGRIDRVYRMAYDRWASRRLPPADVFVGWSGYGLRTLRRAKAAGLRTVLDRALAHPVYLARSIREEDARWGVRTPSSLMEEFIRQEIDLADHVLVPSRFVWQTFVEEGVNEDRLILNPFGVDTVRFQPGVPPRAVPFVVLFVGQVSLRKGIPDLLDAWRLLAWNHAELWLAGRVTLPGALLDRYQGLPGVRFLGHVPAIETLFRQAHVFALPSLAEGSALVTYEAMACGLPVVVTPNAGSVARDGEDGHIVPPRDSEALAVRLEELRGDDALRAQMGRAARRQAESFSWTQYGDRVVGAIHRVAAGARR